MTKIKVKLNLDNYMLTWFGIRKTTLITKAKEINASLTILRNPTKILRTWFVVDIKGWDILSILVVLC